MDGFSVSQEPPPAFKEVKWLADTFVAGMGIGWLVNYCLMVRHSGKGEPNCMALIPLCWNVSWEIMYTIIYPSGNKVELTVLSMGLAANVFVMAAAVRSTRIEWRHSPLVADNAGIIYLVVTLVCLAGHVALAMEIGHGRAYSWSAVVCQLTLSVGGLYLLLDRNNTAGGSWMLWLSRFLGSMCTVGFAAVRQMYWPEAYGWLACPLAYWSFLVFILTDSTYGVCYFLVSRAEAKAGKLD
uniref:IdtB n=1 Tax=Aciculosporium take TaxID=42363 RepID=J7FI90_9HYPO|nr:IdtB [Aciculosporium take]